MTLVLMYYIRLVERIGGLAFFSVRSTRVFTAIEMVMTQGSVDIGLPGVRVFEVTVRPDDRGFFAELYRADWTEQFSETIRQSNLSFTYPGVVRAWHRHTRGQVDYFCVLHGALRVCAYDPDSGKLAEVIASEHKRVIVRVPGHYYHGSMALGPSPATLVYLTSALYDYSNPDEERIAWNDRSVCPTEVNGRKDDPRVGQPWDWLRPVHR